LVSEPVLYWLGFEFFGLFSVSSSASFSGGQAKTVKKIKYDIEKITALKDFINQN
jgi:hypothetical protein